MKGWKHDTAVVDDGASVGEETRIWHFSHVMSTAVIGCGCVIGQNVYIGENVTIGNGAKIQNNVSIYEGVELEYDVFIGPSVVFTNVINPRAFIERKDEFQRTLVKKCASIGANATILCGVTIGAYAMIGAGSVVTKDVPDFAIVKGNPAKVYGRVDKEGNKIEE